ncbi:MAG: TnpV protein [Oscillospiraceae bacterium]|nr:TnpV protein [Oscillospiraceae bacterium]
MENTRNITEVEELTIGRWGTAWQRFMQENYPAEAEELMNTARWDELALEVDREAHSLWELLRKQYAKENPRPTTFMETMKWENTRGFYVDHEVMEQVVLQFRM